MPRIKPFKGLIYNVDKVKKISDVTAPPYDIISDDLQDALYRRSPFNIIRLILGKIKKTDTAEENRYTRAARFFRVWAEKNVIAQDNREALYIYSQKYRAGNKEIDRIGFIGLMKLSTGKHRSILPHENTLLAPKLDRLELIRNVRANLSPIFVLYEDRQHRIARILKNHCDVNEPFIDLVSDGVRHMVWRLETRRAINMIANTIGPKDIFIADGHHRYEVARTYASELQDKSVPKELKESSKYMMAYFCESREDTLTILPTHRVMKDIGMLRDEEVVSILKKFFNVKRFTNLEVLLTGLSAESASCAFGLYTGKGRYYLIRLKDPKVLDRVIINKSREWKRLDVTILHMFVLEHVLSICDEEDNIEFVKDANEAIAMVDKGKFALAFLLNPTKVRQVERIAKLKERMPRKVTYFYPKPLSGLVINKLY